MYFKNYILFLFTRNSLNLIFWTVHHRGLLYTMIIHDNKKRSMIIWKLLLSCNWWGVRRPDNTKDVRPPEAGSGTANYCTENYHHLEYLLSHIFRGHLAVHPSSVTPTTSGSRVTYLKRPLSFTESYYIITVIKRSAFGSTWYIHGSSAVMCWILGMGPSGNRVDLNEANL